MKTRKDSLTFWHYVIWAPHTFYATVAYLFMQAGMVYMTYKRDLDDRDLQILFSIPIGAFLVFWIPSAVHQYAVLRLMRRQEDEREAKWKQVLNEGKKDKT